jgi:hypothetical protein
MSRKLMPNAYQKTPISKHIEIGVFNVGYMLIHEKR